MAATGCDALGLDWTTDIADARRRVGDKVALQGNMDPSVLYAPLRVLSRRLVPFWRALARVKGMYLIWATGFTKMYLQHMPVHL